MLLVANEGCAFLFRSHCFGGCDVPDEGSATMPGLVMSGEQPQILTTVEFLNNSAAGGGGALFVGDVAQVSPSCPVCLGCAHT